MFTFLHSNRGIVPITCDELFKLIERSTTETVSISFFKLNKMRFQIKCNFKITVVLKDMHMVCIIPAKPGKPN